MTDQEKERIEQFAKWDTGFKTPACSFVLKIKCSRSGRLYTEGPMVEKQMPKEYTKC